MSSYEPDEHDPGGREAPEREPGYRGRRALLWPDPVKATSRPATLSDARSLLRGYRCYVLVGGQEHLLAPVPHEVVYDLIRLQGTSHTIGLALYPAQRIAVVAHMATAVDRPQQRTIRPAPPGTASPVATRKPRWANRANVARSREVRDS